MTEPPKEEKIIVNLDGNMKEAFDTFWEDAVAFFFPDMYPKVDFTEKPIALEQEFQNIISFASKKKKIVDKLYQVTMKSPPKTAKSSKKSETKKAKKLLKEIILLHAEAETSPKSTFPKRMFLYGAVAIAKYDHPLTALVIYTGKKIPKKPNLFEMSCFQTKLSYQFRYYAVCEQSEEDLIASDNVFALIILAIKYVIDSPNDYAKRFGFKKKLFKLLIERNYDTKTKKNLITFVKEILRLPLDLEKDFYKFVHNEFIDNDMSNTKTKKPDNSVKGRLKIAEKEWTDFFVQAYYGVPVDELREKIEQEAKAEAKAALNRQNQGIVLHAYHTLGLTFSQIAGMIHLTEQEIKKIISDENGSR